MLQCWELLANNVSVLGSCWPTMLRPFARSFTAQVQILKIPFERVEEKEIRGLAWFNRLVSLVQYGRGTMERICY